MTAIVYERVVVPSVAAARTVIVDVPTGREIAVDGEPLVTSPPFTVSVSSGFPAVGVTVMLVTSFVTASVYDVVADAKAGDSVPDDTVSAESDASDVEEELEASVGLVRLSQAGTATANERMSPSRRDVRMIVIPGEVFVIPIRLGESALPPNGPHESRCGAAANSFAPCPYP